MRAGLRPARGALALAAFALARPGLAQTNRDLATRRLLIEQATAERAAGHHAQALSLAQRAGAVQMSPSVQLFIAQEMDATGDPAGALALADQCAHDVDRDPTIPHRAALLATCRELAAETRGRVGYLVVRAPDPAPDGLRVSVQGAPLNPALLGVPYVVSPGAVAVEATAPGRQPFSTSRAVTVGATEQLTLDLPPVVVAPPVVVVPPPVVVVPRPVVTPPSPPAAPVARSRVAPWTLVVGGSAVLVGGVVLLAVRAAALDGCAVSDGAAVCESQTQLDDARSANGLAIGAGIALGLGTAAVGVGVGWLLLGRGEAARPARVTAGAFPVRGGVVFGVGGRFL